MSPPGGSSSQYSLQDMSVSKEASVELVVLNVLRDRANETL